MEKVNHSQMTLLQHVQTFFRSNRTYPKKQLGQHFLINPDVLSIIIDASELTQTDVVIEIGAGLGCLTAALTEIAKSVIAIEIDPLLHSELETQFANDEDTDIIQADILEIPIPSIVPQGTYPKVIANLPYGITTPILLKLLEHSHILSKCILMMQWEVAERIVAKPGGKDYGALTIGISYYADSELVVKLSPDNFYPVPQVDSALLKITMLEKPRVVVNDEGHFFRVVREAFRGRRKMLKNTLRRFATAEALTTMLTELNIAPERRAETLDISEFAALANRLQPNV